MIKDGPHISIQPIGPLTLELEFSFMVDFNIMFIALLYDLGGLQP